MHVVRETHAQGMHVIREVCMSPQDVLPCTTCVKCLSVFFNLSPGAGPMGGLGLSMVVIITIVLLLLFF